MVNNPLISLHNYKVKVDNSGKGKFLTIIVPIGAVLALEPILSELEMLIKDYSEYTIKISSEKEGGALHFPPGARDPNPYRQYGRSELVGKPPSPYIVRDSEILM